MDHPFKESEAEEVKLNSNIKKEPLDNTDSLHKAIHVEMETRVKIECIDTNKESADIDGDGTSCVKEELTGLDDVVTCVNLLDHLFKIEREGVAMRSLDDTETSLMKNVNTEDLNTKLLKTPIIILDPIFIGACAHCKQQFHTKQELQIHLLGHSLPNVTNVAKVSDNTESENRSLLDDHRRINKKRSQFKFIKHMETHTGKKPFTCNICMLKLTTPASLRKHLKNHTEEKPFVCEICDKKCMYKFQLNEHMRSHTGAKPFKCEFCKKNFSQKTNLNKHMITHTGEKPFTCEICRKNFTRKIHYNAHMITHNNETSYTCDFCEKEFSQKTYLKKHIIIHIGRKPYTCYICNKNFIRKAHLDGHLKTHTMKKCDICMKSFINKISLIRHLRTHTAKKPLI